ncbi:MAG: 5'-nucleotidase C-terminal domain-containing protein [Proteobacteria bacterium]|nr:5'-nucleotidase C-terminal domain-containing protein [Pseudomonadota bacterium]MBU1596542.1 5'-nucleotidase C-terminal domain-containing protein [Pseudomonadota bacterium]
MSPAARLLHPFCGLLLLLALGSCARAAQPPAPVPFSLTIAHVNDTHSALEASAASLCLAGQKVTAELGGFARLKTALGEVRASGGNLLVLHAGDAVQGTLYFNEFQGSVDFDFLNLLGLNAMTLGNHEFDKGPGLTGSLLARAGFPVVSANIDVSDEPALAGRVRPYVVKRFGPDRVGIIGATTPSTPGIVSGVGRVRFREAAPAVAAVVRELRGQGVDKIVVLSHDGYEQDLALARAVPGIDVIVGGHSHTLLGDAARLARLGLTPAGPYPTEVDGPEGGKTLVVQAWRWGMQLGVLELSFDAAGDVAGYRARPMLLAGGSFRQGGASVPMGTPEHAALLGALNGSGAARVVAEDAGISERLAPYARQLDQFRNAPIGASAREDLLRGTATDPGAIIADAYLAKAPGAQLALLMPGGVRQDIFQGPITLGMVMGVLPFGNTLVTLELTGAEVKAALEDAADFRLAAQTPGVGDRLLQAFHAAGFSCRVAPGRAKGGRVSELRVRRAGGGFGLGDFAPVDAAATYRLVTNSFLAGGGDGLTTLKMAAGQRLDTGYLEHDALAEHLKALGTVGAPAERRVVLMDVSEATAQAAPPLSMIPAPRLLVAGGCGPALPCRVPQGPAAQALRP